MSARLIFTVTATLFSWVAAGCTVHFFWQFFYNTTNFNKINSRGFESRILSYGYFVFVWIGIGFCIFRGAEATLHWMPRSWVNISEDGDATWMGESFASMAGFAGALWIVDKMIKLAERLGKAERDCGDR